LVWDVAIPWYGLGNSFPWWRGLLKLAFVSGRIPFMRFSKVRKHTGTPLLTLEIYKRLPVLYEFQLADEPNHKHSVAQLVLTLAPWQYIQSLHLAQDHVNHSTSMIAMQCVDSDGPQSTCRFDVGHFFEGRHGIDWQYNTRNKERIHASLASTGDRELSVRYQCDAWVQVGLRYCRCGLQNVAGSQVT
jgi:hypothetical protein